jgi:hypothetical protein
MILNELQRDHRRNKGAQKRKASSLNPSRMLDDPKSALQSKGAMSRFRLDAVPPAALRPVIGTADERLTRHGFKPAAG